MPGKSYSGALKELTLEQEELKKSLKKSVFVLADLIGERNLNNQEALLRASNYIKNSFGKLGYNVELHEYNVQEAQCQNIIAEKRGVRKPQEIVIVGAHYDSVFGTPGANDNATGVAAIIVLAKLLKNIENDRTLRLVAFVNEEPPYFQTENMGSYVYAKRCRDRFENIVAMISVETIGYYSDKEISQVYPFPLRYFYPDKGNFISFIGNIPSRSLVRKAIKTFRNKGYFPSEGCALLNMVPGIGWSDHWSFWQNGYPAIMVTDTAIFRYPYYHCFSDTSDKILYEDFTRVVSGLQHVVEDLVIIK